MTPIRAASTCCKACDGVGEDEFALLTAFQRLVFFDQKTVRDKNSNGDIGGFQLRLEELKTVTFYF